MRKGVLWEEAVARSRAGGATDDVLHVRAQAGPEEAPEEAWYAALRSSRRSSPTPTAPSQHAFYRLLSLQCIPHTAAAPSHCRCIPAVSPFLFAARKAETAEQQPKLKQPRRAAELEPLDTAKARAKAAFILAQRQGGDGGDTWSPSQLLPPTGVALSASQYVFPAFDYRLCS